MSYGKVHDAYWESERIESLSDRAALLGLFLITGPHRNAIGCFKLGTGAITDTPRFGAWGIDGVSKALQELIDIGFIVRDARTGWTFIVNTFKHDPIKGPKSAVHAAKLAMPVPNNTLVYKELQSRLEPLLDTELNGYKAFDGWPMRSPIEGASKGDAMPNRSPLPKPEPIPEPSSEPKGSDAVASSTKILEENPLPRSNSGENTSVSEPSSDRTWIFGTGLAWLAETVGKPPDRLRSQIGRWLRDLDDDSRKLRVIIEAAQDLNPAEPIAYLNKTVQSRMTEHRAKNGASDEPRDSWGNTRREYETMVKGYAEHHIWPRIHEGPAPGEKGCRVPDDIQRTHGFEPYVAAEERAA